MFTAFYRYILICLLDKCVNYFLIILYLLLIGIYETCNSFPEVYICMAKCCNGIILVDIFCGQYYIPSPYKKKMIILAQKLFTFLVSLVVSQLQQLVQQFSILVQTQLALGVVQYFSSVLVGSRFSHLYHTIILPTILNYRHVIDYLMLEYGEEHFCIAEALNNLAVLHCHVVIFYTFIFFLFNYLNKFCRENLQMLYHYLKRLLRYTN